RISGSHQFDECEQAVPEYGGPSIGRTDEGDLRLTDMPVFIFARTGAEDEAGRPGKLVLIFVEHEQSPPHQERACQEAQLHCEWIMKIELIVMFEKEPCISFVIHLEFTWPYNRGH